MRALSVLSLLTCAIVLPAADAAQDGLEVTSRLSFGVAKGFGITSTEFQSAMDDIATTSFDTGTGAASGTYGTSPAFNLEVPVLFTLRTKGRVAFIGGPALVVTANSNTVKIQGSGTSSGTPVTLEATGDDRYTAIGGKVYAGVRFGGHDGLHTEILPYLGWSTIKEETDLDITARSASTTIKSTSTSSDSGSATLYGITAGLYCTLEQSVELGVRLGYVGAQGKIDETEIEQNGALFAVEGGLCF